MRFSNRIYTLRLLIFVNLFLFSFFSAFSQIPVQLQEKIDSLHNVIENSKHDTILIKILFKLDDIIYAFDPSQDEEINNRVKNICKKGIKSNSQNKKLVKAYKKFSVKAWNNLGIIYMYSGRNEEALVAYTNAVKISKELKDSESASKTYVNMGILKYRAGDLAMAIEYYDKGLKEMERVGNKDGIASTLNNMAMIYKETGDTVMALENYERCVIISKEINATQRTATALVGISDVYLNRGKRGKALEMLYESLELYKKTEDVQGISSVCLNLGKELMVDKKFDESEKYLKQGLLLGKQFQDPRSIGTAYAALANLGLAMKDNKMAYIYADSAYAILSGNSLLKESLDPARIMYFIKKNSDPSFALKMLEDYILLKDSVESESNQRAVIQQQFRYAYEKKSGEDSIRSAEAKKLSDAQLDAQEAQLKQEQTQRYALYGGLILMIVFGIFIYNRFKTTQRQKVIIENQKSVVEQAHWQLEEKNKEVLDSINYAKRIQTAILPSEKTMRNFLKDYFILYKPKDIVAGDFYWYEEVDNYVMIAVADCTGHGVPGALVSVVCHGALNRSVREFGLREPGKILDKTREIVIQEFSKSEEDVKDGMDISLLNFQILNNEISNISWSGANNPLWYIENGEMKEIKADKQPIGKTYQPEPFSSHSLPLSLSALFLFTDGYADQFGGPKGKKFKYSNLQKLLLENLGKDWKQQSQILNIEFDNWKGDLEQVDDVCIIGIRI